METIREAPVAGRRFHPTPDDFDGVTYAGVPACALSGEEVVILTDDPAQARAALAAYCQDMWMPPQFMPPPEAHWVVFERQPEGSEPPWVMEDATEGDEQALRVHIVPA